MAKKETLIIVAHPDDETIWAGGMLLKSKSDNKENRTILCLCRKEDTDRAPRFKEACEMFGAEGYISDMDDAEEGSYKEVSNEDIINRIMEVTKGKEYDSLYTHGENGEYEHIRHLQVHKAVCEMLDKELLLAKEVFFFSYIKNKELGFCIANSNADKLIKLRKPYFKMKKKLIEETYGFQMGGFEEKSCGQVEGFDVRK
jgi:hypothetical protein